MNDGCRKDFITFTFSPKMPSKKFFFSFQMDKDKRNVLRVFRPTFVKDVDQIDDLVDLLDSNNVLAEATIEAIRVCISIHVTKDKLEQK